MKEYQPRDHFRTISGYQLDAWEAYNASYHESARGMYRALGRMLYEQDVHERVRELFARADEQNARLDALLTDIDALIDFAA